MEEDIRDALADIKTSIRAVDKRIDALVTRGEFQATIQRVDAQHEALRRDYDQHELNAPEIVKSVESKIDASKAVLRGEISSTRTATEKRLGEFAITARWAIGVALSALGLLIAAGVLQLIPSRN